MLWRVRGYADFDLPARVNGFEMAATTELAVSDLRLPPLPAVGEPQRANERKLSHTEPTIRRFALT